MRRAGKQACCSFAFRLWKGCSGSACLQNAPTSFCGFLEMLLPASGTASSLEHAGFGPAQLQTAHEALSTSQSCFWSLIQCLGISTVPSRQDTERLGASVASEMLKEEPGSLGWGFLQSSFSKTWLSNVQAF